jgi:hypothetical protein
MRCKCCLVQFGEYKDGDGAAKYHAINIARKALEQCATGRYKVALESVGYIEIGEGFFDIGTDLREETLLRCLGKGKHYLFAQQTYA